VGQLPGCWCPAALIELRTLGRTLEKRAADVLVYFDLPGIGNGPTEANNGRLEHLRVGEA
jgi:transposase